MAKATDSALTGTNLRLILANLGVRNVVLTGILTDQRVSSTVRSLADESFNVSRPLSISMRSWMQGRPAMRL